MHIVAVAATFPDEIPAESNSSSRGDGETTGESEEQESDPDDVFMGPDRQGDYRLPEINPYDENDTYYPFIGAMRTFEAGAYTADTYNPLTAPPPRTIEEAKKRPDRERWIEAITCEINNLARYRAVRVVTAPQGKHIGTSKCVFVVKRTKENTISKYKVVYRCFKMNVASSVLQCRIVARGFTQVI